ncbi:hypothetical protein WISP_131894 [Willisornis vidua]|uniref:Uncharacterized protein n=1 Tax=Willisornis vidua TaxID=1566151 RepID=A0ABQ9CUV1_9PASS|nr:hypothetical protein WISP_131894 [Willisornis vidua]
MAIGRGTQEPRKANVTPIFKVERWQIFLRFHSLEDVPVSQPSLLQKVAQWKLSVSREALEATVGKEAKHVDGGAFKAEETIAIGSSDLPYGVPPVGYP